MKAPKRAKISKCRACSVGDLIDPGTLLPVVFLSIIITQNETLSIVWPKSKGVTRPSTRQKFHHHLTYFAHPHPLTNTIILIIPTRPQCQSSICENLQESAQTQKFSAPPKRSALSTGLINTHHCPAFEATPLYHTQAVSGTSAQHLHLHQGTLSTMNTACSAHVRSPLIIQPAFVSSCRQVRLDSAHLTNLPDHVRCFSVLQELFYPSTPR